MGSCLEGSLDGWEEGPVDGVKRERVKKILIPKTDSYVAVWVDQEVCGRVVDRYRDG